LLYGFMSASVNGFASSMFYISAYILMTLAAFGVILLLSRQGFEAENLDDFKGLNQRSPWYAFLMLIVMFSMAGLPPTLGFYAKFTVLQAALQAGFVWLVVFAVLMAVIGAFYYLRIVKLMYFDDAEDRTPIVAAADVNIVLSVNALGLLVLGLMPQHLMDICAYAISYSVQ
ncbi:MAG TPA: proton-conducting transporter membrane subunit, partial [Methylophilaceae bacterium]|nr:proton-conducting transporter membrane subunit [Methylophilaceae bacterium]